jgi:hypothetical protein
MKLAKTSLFNFFLMSHFIAHFLIPFFSEIDHETFIAWEKKQRDKFADVDWVLRRVVCLSQGLLLQSAARDAIVDYGQEMFSLDVEKLCGSFDKQEELRALPLFVDEYIDEDEEKDEDEDKDKDEDEDEDEEEYEDEKDEDVSSNVVLISTETAETAETIVLHQSQVKERLSHFTTSVCDRVISPLASIFDKRIASQGVSSETFFPLTTRSVERIFSSWKRMMDRNADTKPSTMQALLLLSQFDFHTQMNMLMYSPLTPTITSYLNGIRTQNPKMVLDEISYNKLLQKNIAQKAKHQLNHTLNKIRAKHGITSPPPGGRSSLWIRKHSIEFFKEIGYSLKPHETRYSAIQLRDRVLQLSGYEALVLEPLELLAPVEQLTLTHVVDDANVFEIESVVSHEEKGKKNKYFKYRVKWVGYAEKTWVNERDFVGFSLCEYWKDKVDAIQGIKEAATKKITHRCGDAPENGDGEDDSYRIASIEDHERIEGTIFYKVLWEGQGERTWVPEHQFDDDVILSDYWKKEYFLVSNK